MIKKFISKGLIGVPDCEIELGDEKKIIITGPNGSGKTSLLRHITHPLSSYNRFHKLKHGVDEGYKEIEINYYGREYKVKHVYTRTKTSPKVMSYLFKKVNNAWVNLVENGLPTNFKSIVERELDYYDYLYDICNIGSHNRGIIEQTNANRLEYLKKVTREEVLTELKNKVNENFTEYSANSKYISNELGKFDSAEEIVRKIKLLDSESLKLGTERDNLQKELITLENTDISQLEEFKVILMNKERSNNQINNLKLLLEDVVHDKNLLPKLSYYDVKDTYVKSHTKVSTKLADNEARIMKLNEDLLKIKEVDNEGLKKERDILKEKIDHINSVYKDKKYIDIEDNILYSLDNKINNLISILDNVEDIENIKDILKKYSDKEEFLSDIRKKIYNNEKTHIKLNEQLESLSFTPLVSPGSPTEFPLSSHTLRDIYEDQVSKVQEYTSITLKIADNEKEQKFLEEELIERNNEWRIVENVRSVKFGEEINNFVKEPFPEWLNKDKINKISKRIQDYIMYNKNMRDLEEYYNKFDNLSAILKIEEKNSTERRNIILEELSILEEEDKELRISFLNLEEKMNLILEKDYTDELKSLPYKDIDATISKLQYDINEYRNKIKSLDEIESKVNKIRAEVFEKNKQLKENTDAYYKYKSDLENSKRFNSEFEEVNNELNKIKIIREVVGKSLPARILESYLYDIAKIVNDLLFGFMRIRFDVSEGVEIICTIRAEDRLASDLSQGEKSMLSVALLVAFKKMIKWDVISIDEGSAALDEDNKDRYLNMITKYIESVDTIKQVFIVSHDFFVSDGMDIKIIKL